MATLNTSYGWVQGDQVRLLIASGLTVGSYQIEQITRSMNDLGDMSPISVTSVRDLLDKYDEANANLSSLNATSSGKTLVKADVLEWEAAKGGTGYAPQMEITRVRTLLYQYMAHCVLYANNSNIYVTRLTRS